MKIHSKPDWLLWIWSDRLKEANQAVGSLSLFDVRVFWDVAIPIGVKAEPTRDGVAPLPRRRCLLGWMSVPF